MKKISAIAKNEFLYLIYSKKIFLFFLVLLAVTIFNTYTNIQALQDGYAQYQNTKQMYISQGDNIDEQMKKELHVTEKKRSDGTVEMTVDNPLKYDFEQVGKLLNAIKPKNLLVSILEMITFLFGPFIFSLFGVLLATYDYKNKTIKIKII